MKYTVYKVEMDSNKLEKVCESDSSEFVTDLCFRKNSRPLTDNPDSHYFYLFYKEDIE